MRAVHHETRTDLATWAAQCVGKDAIVYANTIDQLDRNELARGQVVAVGTTEGDSVTVQFRGQKHTYRLTAVALNGTAGGKCAGFVYGAVEVRAPRARKPVRRRG